MTCSPIAGDMATEMAMSAPMTERIRGMFLVSYYSTGPTTSMASLDGEVGAFVAPVLAVATTPTIRENSHLSALAADVDAAVHESQFGTKQTFPCAPSMSAFGSKADIVISESHVCL
ncbi:MAG: hypothetical protein WAK04_09635 [Xanthobacteraceae bacterium]